MNRIFALPGKLADMEVIPLEKSTTAVLDAIGIWAFFIVIGGFAVWVVGTFLKNTKVLRGGDASSAHEHGEEAAA